MSKHTPGPWWQGFLECGWGIAPGTTVQARCLLFVDRPSDDNGNILPSEADARLMTAAPELLAACHSAINLMRGSGFTETAASLMQLKLAVAKAEGE